VRQSRESFGEGPGGRKRDPGACDAASTFANDKGFRNLGEGMRPVVDVFVAGTEENGRIDVVGVDTTK